MLSNPAVSIPADVRRWMRPRRYGATAASGIGRRELSGKSVSRIERRLKGGCAFLHAFFKLGVDAG
jgi:hypothetical protein